MQFRPGVRTALSIACIIGAVVWWLIISIGPKPPAPEDLDRLDPLVRDVVTEALAYANRAPGSQRMWMQLGMVYEANGMTDLARQCYRHVVDERPTDARAWYRLGLVRETLGDSGGAAEAMGRVSPNSLARARLV